MLWEGRGGEGKRGGGGREGGRDVQRGCGNTGTMLVVCIHEITVARVGSGGGGGGGGGAKEAEAPLPPR